MIEKTQHREPFFSIIELLIILMIVGFLFQTLSFGSGFSGFWAIVPVGIVSALLSAYYLVRSHRDHAKVLGFIACLIAFLNASTVPQMFPLRHEVQSATFKDATVGEILHYITKSKDGRPTWRFHVSDRQLACTRVTMAIPPESTLDQTLETLFSKTGSSYTWNWHKSCGNETSPLCASFYVTRDIDRDRSNYEVIINRFEEFQVEPLEAYLGVIEQRSHD